MFAGHVGAALALKPLERRIPLGALLVAALLLDFVLWVLVLLGVEHVVVPEDFARRHYLMFEFPYSHGLVASVSWSALAASVAAGLARSAGIAPRRAALAVAAATFSHFALDVLVHMPELPILGAASPKLGGSLWNHMSAALVLELALTAIGLVVYLRSVRSSRARRIALIAWTTLVGAMTVVGATQTAAPPSPDVIASTSLIALTVLVAVAFAIEGRATAGSAR